MNFKAATDVLTGRVTLGEIAAACGVSQNTIERARMEGEQSRTPPPGWQAALARLARERGGELAELAKQLERDAGR